MNISTVKLAEEVINDNNAEIIRAYVLYIKSQPVVDIVKNLFKYALKDGFNYDEKSVRYFKSSMPGYNDGKEFDAVTVNGVTPRGFYNYVFLFDEKSGELISETMSLGTHHYYLTDRGYRIECGGIRTIGYFYETYIYDKSHVLQSIICKQFGSKDIIIEVTRAADNISIYVSDPVKVKDKMSEIPNYVQMIKENKQLIDEFQLAPKFNQI